jgi:hypothetical protein
MKARQLRDMLKSLRVAVAYGYLDGWTARRLSFVTKTSRRKIHRAELRVCTEGSRHAAVISVI